MTEPQQTLRDIIDKYSPIVRGRKGALGATLKAAAFPVEQGRNALGAIARFPIYIGYENTAGQSVEGCKAVVADTFRRMEKKLQKSFNAAAAREATTAARESSLGLAAEVRADAKALARHCTVVKGAWSTVPENYTFIVKTEKQGDAVIKTTLDDGVRMIRRALGLDQPAPARENPVKIRMKTPQEQQDGNAPKKRRDGGFSL